MRVLKKVTALALSLVMMMSLFAVDGFAADIKKIEVEKLPDKTAFFRGTDWDYGYWQFPENEGFGTFVPREGVISFMHRGGMFSHYQDVGMLDMNGLVVKVTYTNGSTRKISYAETVTSDGVVLQNIWGSPKGGYKVGENTIEIYFPENINVYTTYKIKIMPELGDVDADGTINSTDALTVLQSTVQLIKLNADQQLLADIHADGAINSFDALKILRKCVGLA